MLHPSFPWLNGGFANRSNASTTFSPPRVGTLNAERSAARGRRRNYRGTPEHASSSRLEVLDVAGIAFFVPLVSGGTGAPDISCRKHDLRISNRTACTHFAKTPQTALSPPSFLGAGVPASARNVWPETRCWAVA